MSGFSDNNYTFSLMIPSWYIIIYIVSFTKTYYEKKVVRIVNVIICGTILVGVCLLYIFQFSELYIISWIFKPIVPLILIQYLQFEKKIIANIDKKDKFRFLKGILIGILIMFIPGSKWYSNLISNIENNECLISEMLVFFCGVITMFLNKCTINKISKIKKWHRIENNW
ncbi:hypothetical protein R0131_17995 [Clostridium sp. AL.422]|uniref:hypothetical protein n=1 Tax=Clostridium TaxID=1485 RepID=UPI00293DFFDE|nr:MULTISPECIES: hypothetical protein [unclassified Clostridium]MDV4152724.1 hypothetical protein [Clostridium sp. AL.422]